MPFAYIGLGSNLGDRETFLKRALRRLRPRRVSRILETEPWGRRDQPRFLNAVAEIETPLEPAALLEHLQALERDLGRVRNTGRWGPRTIDLDLLLYEDRRVQSAHLNIPHPRLARRRFVLEGLADLCPDRRVPGLGKTIRELLEGCA